LQDTLKDIGQGMTRIRGVISDLRAFAHPTNGTERETFSIDEALTSAARLCAHELGDIPVVRKSTEGAKAIGSKTQIVHVFMNLLVNAAHATRKKKVISPQITVSCEPIDGRLKVGVLDNGTGVKQEHLPRLLEPFFTTKDVGQGMGLGLSICHTIIKNQGGNIEITTQEGEWTQVSFDLSLEPTKTMPVGDATPAFKEERLELAGSNA
ncbi:MAG TPA: HAMP domain-containing sensor histidine kinase, partial [Tepidisphaeraceae bacterium]